MSDELLIVYGSELAREKLVELLEDIPGISDIRQAASQETGLVYAARVSGVVGDGYPFCRMVMPSVP